MTLSNSVADNVEPLPRKLSRQQQKQQTQARILEAAVQVFSTRSFEEAQIKEIAEIAGVAHGLIFHYFESKRSLYLAAVDAISQTLFNLPSLDQDAPPYNQVRSLLENLCTRLSDNKELFFHYIDYGLGKGKDEEIIEIVHKRNDKIIFWVYDIADLPKTSDTPKLMLEVISLAVDKLVYAWLKANRPYPIEVLIEACVELLVSALRASMLLDPTLNASKGISNLIEQDK